MSQNRDAPAYLEYAASMLARIEYRTATFAERGLLDTMRKECWVNRKLPATPALLAKVLGATEQEIADLLPAVMPFFSSSEAAIICPELEDYRNHLIDRKERQSRGGKVGSALTNKKRKGAKNRMDKEDSTTPSPTPSSMAATIPQLPRRGQVESLVKSNTIKPSQIQSLPNEELKEVEVEDETDPWLKDYKNALKKVEIIV